MDIMRQSACLVVNPITVYSYGFLFNCIKCVALCPFKFCNILMRKRDMVALLFVFLVSRDCCVSLPNGATGLSAVFDCGIS